MTTKQLDALNRKNRIIKRLQAGDTCRAIATDEGVVIQYVYKMGAREGLRYRVPSKPIVIPEMAGTQADQISWQRINAALDAWNIAHKRTKAPRREGEALAIPSTSPDYETKWPYSAAFAPLGKPVYRYP